MGAVVGRGKGGNDWLTTECSIAYDESEQANEEAGAMTRFGTAFWLLPAWVAAPNSGSAADPF